jgi:hypothetical protein
VKWLKNLLGLCEHKREVISRYAINDSISGKQRGELLVLRCVHCGCVKTKRCMP